jgi:twitching motility protein PilT
MERATTTSTDPCALRMHRLLQEAVDREASDVHLIPGFPAALRVHGRLDHSADAAPLDPELVRRMVESIAPPLVTQRLRDARNVDFSISHTQQGHSDRFRVNLFFAQEHLCACLRLVPRAIPSFEWMGFPSGLAERLVAHRNGLVIITGVTGSGKSTTLAALVNVLNQRGAYRIITVEEPIEYQHARVSTSIVTQREVGRDVESFYDGLKFGLRQDPDVILIGEIRDQDTARMALTAAETGHLILTTLHTKDAKGAVTRMVDLFPHEAQDDVRAQLALSLRSVISQHLLPSARLGDKRVLALEIMHVTQAIRIAIRFGKIESIESAIQTGKKDGLQTIDDDLQRLAAAGRISLETARRFAKDPEHLVA